MKRYLLHWEKLSDIKGANSGMVGGVPMTVCVAALCKSGQAIVVASDRMVTAGPPMNLEFEHDRKKIEITADRFVTMGAGDALIGTSILEGVKVSLSKAPGADISIFGEFLRDSYADTRHRSVEAQILRPINYSFGTFQTEIRHRDFVTS